MAGDEPADPADPLAANMFEPVRQPRDGSRVLLRGGRGRSRREQPRGRRRRRVDAGHVRRQRRPRDRVLQHLSGRLRGADGAQRDAGDQGADRAPPPDGGADRAARRRRARRRQVEDRRRRGGRRDRARAGRAGVHRGDEDARHRPDHRRRTSHRRAARWPSISAATRSSIPRSRRRSPRGAGSTGTSRS